MRVVLLDRDGTLVVDPPDERVDSTEKVRLFPDTISSLQYLASNGFAAIIITNQAGIAEGRMTEQEFWDINDFVLGKLAPSGIQILKTYMDSEAPGVVSELRKPGPGMLLQAARDFDLDLSATYMVGDRHTDIRAGIAAGTKTVLVKTAHTATEAPEATYTATTLLDAVHYVVHN